MQKAQNIKQNVDICNYISKDFSSIKGRDRQSQEITDNLKKKIYKTKPMKDLHLLN